MLQEALNQINKCHVHDRAHDKVNRHELEEIRQNVCSHESKHYSDYDGKRYCIYHLPEQSKNASFEVLFKIKLENIETRIRDEIEQEVEEKEIDPYKLQERLSVNEDNKKFRAFNPDQYEEYDDEVIKMFYDFRYIWFPSEVDFTNTSFSQPVNFNGATFSSEAHFYSAQFLDSVDFRGAAFKSRADFRSVTFRSYANFDSVNFLSEADFQFSNFLSTAHFNSATFNSRTHFKQSNFMSDAFFGSALISENAQLFFNPTSFRGMIDFSLSIVKGYIYFEGIVSKQDKSPVFENRLDFSRIRTENPSHITFIRVRLCPGWFVNTDASKYIFTDVAWENHRCESHALTTELNALEARKFDFPHNIQLLKIAFRHLASNAEELNRYEDASLFRTSAFECERLERKERKKKWREKVRNQFQENIECKDVLTASKIRVLRILGLLKLRESNIVHFLYRWLSFYGESWARAAFVLFLIWSFFGFLYWFAGDFGSNNPITLSQALGYSSTTMLLQKSDLQAHTNFTFSLRIIQTVLAPLQAALLALAIRRKFMR